MLLSEMNLLPLLLIHNEGSDHHQEQRGADMHLPRQVLVCILGALEDGAWWQLYVLPARATKPE